MKSLLEPQTNFLAVVKANAYGHGVIQCAKAAIEAGANWLGVVEINSALELRKADIKAPILVLGYPEINLLNDASKNNISVPVISLDYAKEISEMKFSGKLKVHLKVETGLNRLGMLEDEALLACKVLQTNSNIEVEGIYSHLAAVEEGKIDFTFKQIDNFKKIIRAFENQNIHIPLKHIAASAGAMLVPEAHFDMVRDGISTYGLWPSGENKESFGAQDFLEPVLSFKTQIVQVKNIKAGEKVGYGCTFEAKNDMTIGILPVGYFDGLDRGLSNKGEVLVDGARCPIIGRVAMNMIIIKLKVESEKLKARQEVTIIGKDGDEEITVDEIADKLGTINYEVVARLPEHLKRIYI